MYFFSSLLSSSSSPHQHEIARVGKECLIDKVNISYKYQFTLNSAATKHMSENLKLFIAIKYPPKNYKEIVILGYSGTILKLHGFETLQWKFKNLIELHNILYVPDISNTLDFIIDHGPQPDCSFLINNGATAVGFPTFTLLAKNNK